MLVYQYLDFSVALKDWVWESKSRDSSFSYQQLAEQLGVRSRAYMQNVIAGKTTLSEEVGQKLTGLMGLDAERSEYFMALVELKQSRSLASKVACWQKVRGRFQGSSAIQGSTPQSVQEFDYLAHWYIPVVKEIVLAGGFDGNLAKAGRLLVPHISGAQFRFALDVLSGLGIVVLDAEGHVKVATEHVWIESPVKAVAIRQYQRESALLAADALDSFERESRDISTIALGTSLSTVQKIKQKIIDFQKEIVALVEESPVVEQVFHLNLQLFPVSKKLNRSEHE